MPGWEQAAAALEAVALPEDGEPLWGLFLALHAARPAGMHGPAGIPYAEIEAFQRVHGFTLAPWEIRAITAMDRAFLDFAHWQASTNDGEKARIAERYAVPAEEAILTIDDLPAEPPHRQIPASPAGSAAPVAD